MTIMVIWKLKVFLRRLRPNLARLFLLRGQ